ncbi:MAG: diversity-generating retroelement protein Avd [Chlamydiota bacterium]
MSIEKPGGVMEIEVITRMYDFLLWLLPHVEKFPRSHKFTMGDRIENAGLDVLDLLLDAKYRSLKVDVLRRANLKLEQLRFLLRLSKDLRMLNVKSYLHGCRLLNEVGKQVGGWIKSAK